MDFVEQALRIVDEHLRLKNSQISMEAAARRSTIEEVILKHDAIWKMACARFTKEIAGSKSQAWADQVAALHATRRANYETKRRELEIRLQEIDASPTPKGYDKELVCRAVRAIEHEISKYSEILSVKRRQMEVIGEYGDIDRARWLAETVKFSTRNPVVVNSVNTLQQIDDEFGFGVDWFDFAAMIVAESVIAVRNLPSVSDGDGIAYERLCATLLENAGWLVRHTPTTGDQGVDLIAKYGRITAAIQCKNTAQPVGNSAVQEVYAGRAFYEASIAIVVSVNGYTPSAIQLSRRLDVLLVSSDSLLSLHHLVEQSGEV